MKVYMKVYIKVYKENQRWLRLHLLHHLPIKQSQASSAQRSMDALGVNVEASTLTSVPMEHKGSGAALRCGIR